MTSDSDGPAYLEGETAAGWFYNLRGAGTVLDFHRQVVRQVFGDSTPVGFRAPLHPHTGRPTELLIEIDEPIDDPESWERLVTVQQTLLMAEAELRERSGRPRPLHNVAVTLTGLPERWATVVDRIDGIQ